MSDLFESITKATRIRRSAEISPCDRYRWWLRRTRMEGKGTICFVMLNPSTADGTIDDPTIRRCIGFAWRWGYSSLSVRNLFAFRATKPSQLLTACNPTGGERGDIELAAAKTADMVVAAWGAGVPFGRDEKAIQLLAGCQLWCLGRTKFGAPRHPLYVRADKELEVFP